jgi:uncharacterized protein (DUF1778 family)
MNAAEPKKRGRRPTGRTENLHVKLRADESLAFRLAAEAADMNLSDWVRRACREAAIPRTRA